MKDINDKIKAANGRLKSNNWGVTIEQIGGRLFLRGTLPSKPNQPKNKPYQQRISIAPANSEGLKLAEQEAKVLAIRLAAKTFDWGDYMELETEIPKTIGEWVEDFKKDYFLRRKLNYASQKTYHGDYELVFKCLNYGNYLTEEEILNVVRLSEPDTRNRKRFCLALGALAKFAGIDINLNRYAGNYSPNKRQPRDIPSDADIVRIYHEISDPKWQWVYGLMATYGLRNHEVFFVNLAQLRSGNKILEVSQGKTGGRKIWPLHPEWFEYFNLPAIKIPSIKLDRSNSHIGHTVSQRLRRTEKIPFKPYDLRHAWAIRSLAYGIDISLAAQQMGHSLQVHSNIYHSWISESHHQRAFELAMKNSDRPKPPMF